MATTLTNTVDQPFEEHRLDSMFVLAGRPLRCEASLERTSRFRDMVWRLEPAIFRENSLMLILDFTRIPARWRPLAKELFYAMLAGDLPPSEPRPVIATVYGHFRAMTRFLGWVDTWPSALTGRPVNRLDELVGADLLAYRRDLERTQRSPTMRERSRVSVRVLWRYRSVLPDRLAYDPGHLEGWTDNYRNRRRPENATGRIPETVHGPLMAWALRFVDDFADDIITALERWRICRAILDGPIHTDNAPVTAALQALLDQHLADRRPIPGYDGALNLRALALTLGCSRKEIERHRAKIDTVAAIVGRQDCPWFEIATTAQLDGRPWIQAIVGSRGIPEGLGKLTTMLQAAAYVVIAFLSGMRDSEIKELRRGCFRIHRDDTGRIYRRTVLSRAFKGETDSRGVEAFWVIGAPAARAITVLERLQPAGTELLFALIDPWNSTRPASRSHNRALSSIATNTQINNLVDWINEYCASRGRLDSIPLVNQRRWRLTTPQFRRTLAWFIARRPGGAIAGAIAYRHLSIQMFEGYAGTSDSGFRAEVESEQALARGEHLLTMIDQHQHTALTGPAADEAAQRLTEFGDHARFGGTVITDERRLRRLMARKDPAIYPDKYVTCVHTHITALCQQKRDNSNTLRPDIGTCKPLVCRNVALTPDNIDNLRAEIAHITRELDGKPLLPPLLRHQLHARRDDIEDFLTRHDPGLR
ncbi:hypothetical protein C5F51_22745 [Nocardia nova]|uniref:Integrase n=2 Tax=Nocardia nova TaxID=37330 RepID=A0A2S6A262_9NOCA|nr:hypothetical protein C5F51_22745 [Nocardia nova]